MVGGPLDGLRTHGCKARWPNRIRVVWVSFPDGSTWRYQFKDGRLHGQFAYDDKTLKAGILKLLSGDYEE